MYTCIALKLNIEYDTLPENKYMKLLSHSLVDRFTSLLFHTKTNTETIDCQNIKLGRHQTSSQTYVYIYIYIYKRLVFQGRDCGILYYAPFK